MTVIVWDGHTLATDAAATDGTALWKTQKAWRYTNKRGEPVILSGAGPLQTILAMRDWCQSNAHPNEFPAVQLTPQFCHFVIIRADGLHRYEQGLFPIYHGTDQCAFGEGKEFAYGALAMGADAKRAVEIAIEYSPHCGHEARVYSLGE
jgi:hypothetical protein